MIKGKVDVGVTENNTKTLVARTQGAIMSKVVENEVWRGRYFGF